MIRIQLLGYNFQVTQELFCDKIHRTPKTQIRNTPIALSHILSVHTALLDKKCIINLNDINKLCIKS
jgi:hypothetical protein